MHEHPDPPQQQNTTTGDGEPWHPVTDMVRTAWASAQKDPRSGLSPPSLKPALQEVPSCCCEHSRKVQHCTLHSRVCSCTGARGGRECSGRPAQDFLAHHTLPCALERLLSCRLPRGLTNTLALPSHPDLLRADGRTPCPAPITSRRWLQQCQGFEVSSQQHKSRDKHRDHPWTPAQTPEEEGLETVRSWSSEGHGLMGSHTQGSSSSVGCKDKPAKPTSKGNPTQLE